MPVIDWRTYGAGVLASMSVITALYIGFSLNRSINWFHLVWQAAISGPFWVHVTLVFVVIRHRQWSLFSYSPKTIGLAFGLALLMPMGIVRDTPIPWTFFFVTNFVAQTIDFSFLLLFGGLWFLVWLILLSPIMALPSHHERFMRGLVVAVSLAYGVIPSLTLFFKGFSF